MRRQAPQVVPSQDGAGESARALVTPVSCEGCGTVFAPSRPLQRCCSARCRATAARQRDTDRLSALLEQLLAGRPREAGMIEHPYRLALGPVLNRRRRQLRTVANLSGSGRDPRWPGWRRQVQEGGMTKSSCQVVQQEIGGRLTLPHRLVGTDEASDLAQEQIRLGQPLRLD